MSIAPASTSPRSRHRRYATLGAGALVCLLGVSCSSLSDNAASSAGTASPEISQNAQSDDCGPSNGAEFICGVDNVEDFVRLSDGHLLGSDLAAPGTTGHFHLFGPDRSVRAIEPQEIIVAPNPAYGDCAAPDWNLFNPHGMGSLDVEGRTSALYVVNHGGRDVVELFDVDLAANAPRLTWTGCLVPPEGAWPDDVAALPNGDLLVTSLWNPDDPGKLQKAIDGAPQGQLLKWTADGRWSQLPGLDAISGHNGVIASADGTTAYMAAWSGKQLVTIDMASGAVETTGLEYTPDNLTWSADGRSIYIGGTTANVEAALNCFTSSKVNCPETGVRVDRYDPAAKTFETLVEGTDFGQFGMATGAIDVGDELWVNSYRSDRIAVFDAN
ncbi:MAG: hypothetical protein K0Q61_143 [Rhodococcus erythropolis]|nr:hypothetical protein [Rhodococcus erythropolis]